MAGEEIDFDHLAELREAAQKAYAWREYVNDFDVEEIREGQAERDYDAAMVDLEGALSQHGLRVSVDLDAPGDKWFERAEPTSAESTIAAAEPAMWQREFLGADRPALSPGDERSR